MTEWDKFFKDKIIKILTEKATVIDIGGGLRVLSGKGNRYDVTRSWAIPHLKRVEYKVLDPVSDYNPDILGDIHNLPFDDGTQDAILCLAVLEHVTNPIKASQEMYRVLKPGGYCFVYVPFLYYYHSHEGYFKDYWRFTHDTLKLLFDDFSEMEICRVRGAVESWAHLVPFGRSKVVAGLARFADKLTDKTESAQVSGYHIFLKK